MFDITLIATNNMRCVTEEEEAELKRIAEEYENENDEEDDDSNKELNFDDVF